MITIILSLLGCLVGFIIAFMILKRKGSNATSQTEGIIQAAILNERYTLLGQQHTELRLTCKGLQTENSLLHKQFTASEEIARHKQEKMDTMLKDKEELGEVLKSQFRLLAADILETKAKTFNDQQEGKLNDLLKPFREQISDFKKGFEDKYLNEAKEKSTLKAEIAQLLQMNLTISRQATDLTEALRGSNKQQGDWGEGILERILEYAGLQEGIHYTTQSSSKNDDGQTIRPDVIVHLPQGRKLVIDSKVSLNNYWDYCAAADLDARSIHLPLIIRSVKAHIDGLYSKMYIDISGTPDFIIMFMPVEAAYITALQHDHALWQYAYNKKILLISPTNLIPAMKMVTDLWQRDAINQNAQAISDKAGALYDKLAGFVENFEKMGSQISTLQRAYDAGMGQLSQGKGNLISQVEQIKKLNVKTKKQLPTKLVETALLEDGTDPDEEEQ
ncbi:MAG: DNA recombination protein RmuC [Taibaiella sp.]|nr:DNA recombination protein RmuC [Taibaiella sp.]